MSDCLTERFVLFNAALFCFDLLCFCFALLCCSLLALVCFVLFSFALLSFLYAVRHAECMPLNPQNTLKGFHGMISFDRFFIIN